MKFSLSSEQKKEAYQNVKKELEKTLILRLTILGIDPEKFDEKTFTPNPHSTAEKDIESFILKIKEIEDKISSL